MSDTSSESDDEDICRFPRFIVLEYQDDSSQVNLSPFVIKKKKKSNTSKTVKKTEKWELLVKIERKKTCRSSADFIHTKIITYPHQNLNRSKEVVRCQDLSLCPLERIKTTRSDRSEQSHNKAG